jgi:seryl-tRNA synthetase
LKAYRGAHAAADLFDGRDAVTTEKDSRDRNVDLDAVAALVAKLDQDLQKLSGSSADVQRLREEVAVLKRALESPAPKSHRVEEGLHGVRNVFARVTDEVVADGVKGSQYVAEIGRILGL